MLAQGLVVRAHGGTVQISDYSAVLEPAGVNMGRLYTYRDTRPQLADGVVLFDSAEITGDVHIGRHTIIGAGVKIIGDSHDPVRIGARVQILENTVLPRAPSCIPGRRCRAALRAPSL